MAGSRLPNFGTIFSRVTGLLETGALKEAPLWYNVYKKYPPDVEPYSERPLPPIKPILEIVYEEDFERAKKKNKSRGGSRIPAADNVKPLLTNSSKQKKQ